MQENKRRKFLMKCLQAALHGRQAGFSTSVATILMQATVMSADLGDNDFPQSDGQRDLPGPRCLYAAPTPAAAPRYPGRCSNCVVHEN